MPEYFECRNPLCDRMSFFVNAYCCWACYQADKGKYEINELGVRGHSMKCNERKYLD